MTGRSAEDAGTPFGRYLLRELIGRGGMGEVFRAVAVGASGFEKSVVVKRILPQLGSVSTMSEMFVEEARLMSRLVHPNIVQVFDFGRGARDDHFLVMELVDGVDLRTFLRSFWDRDQPMPASLALYVTTQILRGLHYAHTKAGGDGHVLVHRDVSPGNVLLSTVGEVKLADFGVALVSTSGADQGPNTMAGKHGYMAPEQHRGEALDARADVFSTAVVTFQMLTGKVPFSGESGALRQRRAAEGRALSLEHERPELPTALADLLATALAPAKEERFATARAMRRAVEEVCEAGVPMASDDDLAEQVERVSKEVATRRAKPVVSLGEGGGLVAGTLISRSGPRSVFTMKATMVTEITATEGVDLDEVSAVVTSEREPEPIESAPVAAEADPTKPPTKPLTSATWMIAVLAFSGLGIAVWLGLRSTDTRTTGPAVSPTMTATGLAEASISTVESAVPEVERGATPHAPAIATVTTSVSSVAPRAAWPSPRPSAMPAPACRGKVLLSAKGSWWVSGGPSRVQAPGQYEWPCGSYSLTGTSRADKRIVSTTLTLREDRLASARFE